MARTRSSRSFSVRAAAAVDDSERRELVHTAYIGQSGGRLEVIVAAYFLCKTKRSEAPHLELDTWRLCVRRRVGVGGGDRVGDDTRHTPMLAPRPQPTTRQTHLLIRHHITYMALPTALFKGQNPLGMPNANAMKHIRSPKHESWPVCDPRAAPPGERGLGSWKWYKWALSARKWGGRWPIFDIAHQQPGPVCVEGGVSRWQVGVAGLGLGAGAGAAPAPTRGAWGAS
jgi:hypothetical protein